MLSARVLFLTATILVIGSKASLAEEIKVYDGGFPTPIGPVHIQVFWDTESQDLIERGEIDGIPMNEHRTKVERKSDDLLMYSESESLRLGAKIEFDMAINTRSKRPEGYRIRAGARNPITRKFIWSKWASNNTDVFKAGNARSDNAITLQTRARGHYRKYFLNVGNDGVVNLSAEAEPTAHWRLVPCDGFYRLENSGHTDYTGWYLDIADDLSLIVSESSRGTGTRWTVTRDGEELIFQNQCKNCKVAGWYLDIDGGNGRVTLSHAKGTGVNWGFDAVQD